MIDREELIQYENIANIVSLFQEIDKIPRESGNETQISNFIADFAKKRKLNYSLDKFNNVIVYLPSNNNNNNTLAIQSHVDMVCEKRESGAHDFNNDPIDLIIDDGYIKSKETNIGADNGIGVAMMLAIIDQNNFKHCNLELIFTAAEESTMRGAKNLDPELINSNKIISLDAFRDDVITYGCASNLSKVMTFESSLEKLPELDHKYTYVLKISGLKGGHSGKDINEYHGNPIFIGMQLLRGIYNKYDLRINYLDAGTWVTVIPQSSTFTFSTTHPINTKFFDEILPVYENNCKKKLNNSDISIDVAPTQNNVMGFNKQNTLNILNYFTRYPNGCIKIKGPEKSALLSSNIGTVWIDNNKLKFETSIRSNLDLSQTQIMLDILERQEKKHHIETLETFDYPGYKQNEENELVQHCSNIYKKLFKSTPQLREEHFTLECAYFNQKIKNLEYVSISPNICYPHNYKETVSLDSINKTWIFLEEIITNYSLSANNVEEKQL